MNNTSQIKSNNFSFNKRTLQSILGIPGVIIYKSRLANNQMTLYTFLKSKTAKCPNCSKRSRNIHSHYQRKLTDLIMCGKAVQIILKVRKFRCNNKSCTQSIFSEQHMALAERHSRRTVRATLFLRQLLVEVSSSKGAVISKLCHINQSSSTCLRIVKSIDVPIPSNLAVVGIYDWAYRKGKCYGTIIIDIANHRPVALLEGRDQEVLKKWLKKNNTITHITRDRSSSYSKAITTVAPQVEQIADRFHLVKNLGDHIAEEIRREYKAIKKSYLTQEKEDDSVDYSDTILTSMSDNNNEYQKEDNTVKEQFVNPRTEELYSQVHKLNDNNYSQRAIARTLKINRKTVRRYLQAKQPQSYPYMSRYRNNYEDYMEIIKRCLCDKISIMGIYKLIVAQGFKGNQSAFYKWFNSSFPDYPYKKNQTILPTAQVLNHKLFKLSRIAPNKLAIHLTNPEWGVSKETGECSSTHILAEKMINSSLLLQEMREAYSSFRELLNSRDESKLTSWLENYQNTKNRGIRTFIKGVRSDIRAVENAIKYQWSNGVVEGHVNRLKTKKREMYGRAGFDLLMRKVILSKSG